MSSITIPADALGAAFTAAVMSQISDDARNTLIAQAIEYLNKPQGGPYDREKRTPLQQAFDIAMSQTVHAAVREIIEAEPVRSEIVEKVRESLKLFGDAEDYEIHDSVVRALVSWAQEKTR